MVSSAFLNVSKVNPYLYSGKETERMNGLNEYDFTARWYDHAVPGFTTPDPLAENHYSDTPYAYCGSNPVNRVDPTGLDYENPDGTLNPNGSDYDNLSGVTVTPDGNYVNNQALVYLWNHNQEQGDDDIAPDRSQPTIGDVGANHIQANPFAKLPAAAGMTVDVMNTVGAAAKCAVPFVEKVLRRTLTRPTTVVGAIFSALPASIDLMDQIVKI